MSSQSDNSNSCASQYSEGAQEVQFVVTLEKDYDEKRIVLNFDPSDYLYIDFSTQTIRHVCSCQHCLSLPLSRRNLVSGPVPMTSGFDNYIRAEKVLIYNK